MCQSPVIAYSATCTNSILYSPTDPNTGMVQSIRARERAHDGPVTALAAAGGRLWSSGGSAAFVCLREWTQRGEFINKHDLRSTGTECVG